MINDNSHEMIFSGLMTMGLSGMILGSFIIAFGSINPSICENSGNCIHSYLFWLIFGGSFIIGMLWLLIGLTIKYKFEELSK
jgi:uncharacterized membrane protein